MYTKSGAKATNHEWADSVQAQSPMLVSKLTCLLAVHPSRQSRAVNLTVPRTCVFWPVKYSSHVSHKSAATTPLRPFVITGNFLPRVLEPVQEVVFGQT